MALSTETQCSDRSYLVAGGQGVCSVHQTGSSDREIKKIPNNEGSGGGGPPVAPGQTPMRAMRVMRAQQTPLSSRITSNPFSCRSKRIGKRIVFSTDRPNLEKKKKKAIQSTKGVMIRYYGLCSIPRRDTSTTEPRFLSFFDFVLLSVPVFRFRFPLSCIRFIPW